MPADPGSANSVPRDLTVVALVTALATFIAVRFNLSEALFSWTRTREWLQLDELPGVLLVFAACLVWFSARRFFDARHQIVRRRELDVQLAGALSENRRLAQQYVQVQESERRALARDLHDELGQYLNAIKIDAVALRERLKADPAAREAAAQMLGNIDLVQGTVIGLIRQLRPAGLDEFGLAGALEQCVAEWGRRLPHTEAGPVPRCGPSGPGRAPPADRLPPGAGGPHQCRAAFAGLARGDHGGPASRLAPRRTLHRGEDRRQRPRGPSRVIRPRDWG